MNHIPDDESLQVRKAALLADSARLRDRLHRSVEDLQNSVRRLRQISNLGKAAGLLTLSTAPLLGFLFGRKRRSLGGVSGKAAFVWQLLRRFIPIVTALRAAQSLRPGQAAEPHSVSVERPAHSQQVDSASR